MMTTRVSNHVATGGLAGTAFGSEMHIAWVICLAALLISLAFALLRFLPRSEV
jgi:uncharacterized membrane protein YtjA (UPF0391 family)